MCIRDRNQSACVLGLWTAISESYDNGRVWEVLPERVKAPYMKSEEMCIRDRPIAFSKTDINGVFYSDNLRWDNSHGPIHQVENEKAKNSESQPTIVPVSYTHLGTGLYSGKSTGAVRFPVRGI